MEYEFKYNRAISPVNLLALKNMGNELLDIWLALTCFFHIHSLIQISHGLQQVRQSHSMDLQKVQLSLQPQPQTLLLSRLQSQLEPPLQTTHSQSHYVDKTTQPSSNTKDSLLFQLYANILSLYLYWIQQDHESEFIYKHLLFQLILLMMPSMLQLLLISLYCSVCTTNDNRIWMYILWHLMQKSPCLSLYICLWHVISIESKIFHNSNMPLLHVDHLWSSLFRILLFRRVWLCYGDDQTFDFTNSFLMNCSVILMTVLFKIGFDNDCPSRRISYVDLHACELLLEHSLPHNDINFINHFL